VPLRLMSRELPRLDVLFSHLRSGRFHRTTPSLELLIKNFASFGARRMTVKRNGAQ